jgi:hypothetical protein
MDSLFAKRPKLSSFHELLKCSRCIPPQHTDVLTFPHTSQVGEFMDGPFVGAGFQLSSADVLIDVPFDPKLDMLFVGEEILYSARLWTKGWDMFAPDMNLVWHHYNR